MSYDIDDVTVLVAGKPAPSMAQLAKGTPSLDLPRDPERLGALCSRCCLRRCAGPVFWSGPLDAELAVVGEAPGWDEVDVKIPFVGASGRLLDRVLSELNYPRSKVLVVNVLLHMPPGGNLEDYVTLKRREAKADGLPFEDPTDLCRPALFRILGIPACQRCERYKLGPDRCACKQPSWVWLGEARTPPKVIISVGNAALWSLYGVRGITRWRGSPINMGGVV